MEGYFFLGKTKIQKLSSKVNKLCIWGAMHYCDEGLTDDTITKDILGNCQEEDRGCKADCKHCFEVPSIQRSTRCNRQATAVGGLLNKTEMRVAFPIDKSHFWWVFTAGKHTSHWTRNWLLHKCFCKLDANFGVAKFQCNKQLWILLTPLHWALSACAPQ